MKKLLGIVNKKTVFYFVLFLFVVSLIPILLLSRYSFPCADDFSASDTAYIAWQQSRSLVEVIKAAVENVIYNYKEWSGVFASVFWTSLQPGIFGEQYYGITTWITVFLLIFSGIYFYSVILKKYMHANFYETGYISFLYLFTIIQCMPSGLEGLYWHAGVVNYTWAFAFLLLLSAIQLSNYKEYNKTKKIIKTIAACILSILVGGGNFITALQGCIWLSFILLTLVVNELKIKNNSIKDIIIRLRTIILPFFILLLAFFSSVLAPGNQVRMNGSEGMGVIKAILLSFYYAMTVPLENWMKWPILLLLGLSVPSIVLIVKRNKRNYKWPGLVMIVAFGILSAGFTPSLYAQGSMEAGRLHNTVYFLWITLLYLLLIYLIGWIINRVEIVEKKNDIRLTNNMKVYILTIMIIWGMLSILACKIDPKTYISSEAFALILSGKAMQYKKENIIRIEELKNKEKQDIILSRFSDPPELLLFQDISADPNEWINYVVATYYEKNSVKCE